MALPAESGANSNIISVSSPTTHAPSSNFSIRQWSVSATHGSLFDRRRTRLRQRSAWAEVRTRLKEQADTPVPVSFVEFGQKGLDEFTNQRKQASAKPVSHESTLDRRARS